MKSATIGTVSGCVVWMFVFLFVGAFMVTVMMPVGFLVGSLALDLSPNFVEDILGPYFCPPESTAEIVTRAVTGVRTPATSYQMQCVDSNGNVVKEPSPNPLILWLGIVAVTGLIIGLILSALIAFLLAAPAGVLIVNLSNRLRTAYTARKMKSA